MSTMEPSMIEEEEVVPPARELAELLAQPEYYNAVRNRVRFLVGNPDLVEDLTQNVYVKVMKSLHTIDSMKGLHAWLYQVTGTTVKDHFRIKRNKFHDSCVTTEGLHQYESSHDLEASYIRKEDVVRNWPLLTARQEEVLSMLAQGFSMYEIEQKLDKKQSVVYEARRMGRRTLLTGTVATRKKRIYGNANTASA